MSPGGQKGEKEHFETVDEGGEKMRRSWKMVDAASHVREVRRQMSHYCFIHTWITCLRDITGASFVTFPPLCRSGAGTVWDGRRRNRKQRLRVCQNLLRWFAPTASVSAVLTSVQTVCCCTPGLRVCCFNLQQPELQLPAGLHKRLVALQTHKTLLLLRKSNNFII